MDKRSFELVLSSYFVWMPAPPWCYRYTWGYEEHGPWKIRKRRETIHEELYLILLTDDLAIKVYSSIYSRTGVFRENGMDRIHFQLVRASNLRVLGIKKRCNRTGANGNPLPKKIRTKVEEILTEIGYFEPKKCEGCGGNFILKKSKAHRYIFACENYGTKAGEHDHPRTMKGKSVHPEDVGKALRNL